MTLLWDLYWPVLAVVLVVGIGFGWFALSPPDKGPRWRAVRILAGAVAAMAAAALWHGPGGAGERFAGAVETDARAELDRLEMGEVDVRIDRSPIRRSFILDGPGNDFQKRELRRLMEDTVGIADAHWRGKSGDFTLPLIVEAMLAALLVFPFGLALAYLVIIRRRANANWRW